MIFSDWGRRDGGESRGAEVEASGAEVASEAEANDAEEAAVEADEIDEASERGECTLGAVESEVFLQGFGAQESLTPLAFVPSCFVTFAPSA